jgi:hypothetical protein
MVMVSVLAGMVLLAGWAHKAIADAGSVSRFFDTLGNTDQIIALNETSAISTLDTLNTLNRTFLSEYESGFPDRLERLGQPRSGEPRSSQHTGLLSVGPTPDWVGPNTFQKDGYNFTYRPGPGAFPRVATYTIMATPVLYLKSGSRSFVTDQGGGISFTDQNTLTEASDWHPLPRTRAP